MNQNPMLTVHRSGPRHDLHTTNRVEIVVVAEYQTVISDATHHTRAVKVRVTGNWQSEEKSFEGERVLTWRDKNLEPVQDSIERLVGYTLSDSWRLMRGDRRVSTELPLKITASIGVRGNEEYQTLTFRHGIYFIEAEIAPSEGLAGFLTCLRSAMF